MAFDGMMVHAITTELKQRLKSGRITKIYQPFDRDLIFHIRAQRKNMKLFISANPTYPRIHLINETLDNPQNAPMFCMVLRKYFEGGIIQNIEQVNNERIIYIDIRSKDELGDTLNKRLIIELMGKYSNIMVVDPEQNIILDSIHHVSQAINQHRTIFPGREYIHPPEQHKLNPFEFDHETFLKKINFNEGQLDRQIVEHFSGISPLLAKEIVYQAGLPNRESLVTSFNSVMEKMKQQAWHPTTIVTKQKSYFYLFPLDHVQGKKQSYASVSEMIEAYFHGKAERDRIKQRASDLIRFLTNEKKKNEKKIKKLENTLKESEKADQYQLYGELLTAYMHQVNRGDKSIEVVNYYDETGATVSIPLDPEISPNANAQAYFKKYNKTKKSKKAAQQQIILAKKEVAYFDTLFQQLDRDVSNQDIEEIREELIEEKYIRDRSKKKKKKNTKLSLQTYESSDGTPIYVGKNNKQNDYLTNKQSSPTDTWLHTKDIPGSHVVIRGKEFSEETLLEAAQIAAYFSKASESGQIPVDYTLVKNVRKPSGSKPGYVIYDKQQTLYVTPDVEKIKSMHKK